MRKKKNEIRYKSERGGVTKLPAGGYNQCVYGQGDGDGGDKDVTVDVAADLKHSARVTATKVYRSMTSNLTKAEIRALSDPDELVAAVVTKSTIALDALGEAVRDTLQGRARLSLRCAHDGRFAESIRFAIMNSTRTRSTHFNYLYDDLHA